MIRNTAIAALALLAGSAVAEPVQLQVTVENLAPANSIAFSPLSVSFHSGIFDSFDLGSAANLGVASIAESGNGAEWFSAFAAADASATTGAIGGGPLTPGATASATFTVDAATSRFFSFGSMVVPSNDSFIGNDSPTAYQLFDAAGNLAISEITQYGDDIWDAGSEVNGVFGAAFIAGSAGADRIAENGVITRSYTHLDQFNGLETGAGYTFDRQFAGDDAIYRISFAVVPTPGALSLLGMGGLVALRRRR